MKNKTVLTLSLAAASLLTALPAAAQFAKAEDAIQYRQSAFRVLGHHFSRLGGMATGRAPYDAAAAAADGSADEAAGGEAQVQCEAWRSRAKHAALRGLRRRPPASPRR